jgi:hypothetical protein
MGYHTRTSILLNSSNSRQKRISTLTALRLMRRSGCTGLLYQGGADSCHAASHAPCTSRRPSQAERGRADQHALPLAGVCGPSPVLCRPGDPGRPLHHVHRVGVPRHRGNVLLAAQRTRDSSAASTWAAGSMLPSMPRQYLTADMLCSCCACWARRSWPSSEFLILTTHEPET